MKWLCDYTKQDQRGFREVLDPNAKEDKHTGIHLMAADGYILENYDINISSNESSKNNIACQDVYIKLLAKPEDNSAIIIDSQTSIAFEDGLTLAIEGPITLGGCKNLKIKSHDFGREVALKGGFSLKGVTDSIIRFEKPREEMKKPITDGLVSFNKVHKVDISIPENVKKAEIRDNFNGGMAILKGAPLNRIVISAFEILMSSCRYSFNTQYSSLDISADIVRCESATFSSEYNGAIEVKSGKKDERSEFKAKEADFNFTNVGEGTVNLSDTNVLSNSIVSTYDKTANLNLSGARLSGSAIHFTQNDDHVYKIKTLIANHSNIDNAAGTFSGTIENAKVDYLTFKPGSSLYLNMRDRDYKDTHYEVKNLTLEEDAKFLIVPTYGFNDNEKEPIIDKICSLENVVAQGESEITGYVHFDMFNSVVSNFRGSFSGESYRTNLSNSMFSGECDIKGVKSIDTSSVENSSIRGNNAEIRNEMIKNLTNYSGAQRKSNENAGLANTKELDLL